MSKEQILKIVLATEKECKRNFDKYKMTDYTIAGKTLIPFTSENISCRKVYDGGTDEDRDIDVCYTEKGWEIMDMVVQSGAGVQKVIKDISREVSSSDIAEKIYGMNLWKQMEFISKAYKILLFSEFKSDLYKE